MDASTFTAFRLAQQRAADLDREHALRVAQRVRHEACALTAPAPRPRWIRLLPGRRVAVTACDPSTLALAGPSS